jgi:hypothetical protein
MVAKNAKMPASSKVLKLSNQKNKTPKPKRYQAPVFTPTPNLLPLKMQF